MISRDLRSLTTTPKSKKAEYKAQMRALEKSYDKAYATKGQPIITMKIEVMISVRELLLPL